MDFKDFALRTENLQEDGKDVGPKTKDAHRALVSLQEELAAIDAYQQRIDVAEDGELKSVLEHNRDEEMAHAAMLLEWLRRNVPGFDKALGENLDRKGPIVRADH